MALSSGAVVYYENGKESNLLQCVLCSTSVQALKAHSHYCIFCVRLRQTVAFLQGDRNVPISALMQPTAENADHCV